MKGGLAWNMNKGEMKTDEGANEIESYELFSLIVTLIF